MPTSDVSAPEPLTAGVPARRGSFWRQGIAGAVLAVLLAGAMWFLFFTPAGKAVRKDPDKAAADVRQTVAAHPVEAATVYLLVYVTFSILCLPVWCLQTFAGIAFGLWEGVGLSLVGSSTSAGTTAWLAHWFAGDWVHGKLEAKAAKLRWLDETLGHNGLLVVMTVRLAHVVPFGVSNVLLGLSRVSVRDVAIGTLLGNVPAAAFYVGVGAGYVRVNTGHLFADNWRFMSVLAAINLVLLVPLGLRYCKPEWFKKIGVE